MSMKRLVLLMTGYAMTCYVYGCPSMKLQILMTDWVWNDRCYIIDWVWTDRC